MDELVISIHAPRERSDTWGCLQKYRRGISIHAPRERSDFYLRPWAVIAIVFQSTLLVRGATRLAKTSRSMCQISIHAPRERSDLCLHSLCCQLP